jgi:hypothetical protein
MADAVSVLDGGAPEAREPARGPVAFYRVPREVLDLLWPQVEVIFINGMARERARHYSTGHIHDWVVRGTHHLFVATRDGHVIGAVLTETVIQPNRQRSFIAHLLAGHDLKSWLPLGMERMTEQGHLEGATEFRVAGRKGWLRLLKPYGFAFEAVVLTRQEL